MPAAAPAAGVPGAGRPQKQILQDLDAADEAAFKTVYYDQLVDPKYRPAFSRDHADKVRHHLDLLRELQKSEKQPDGAARAAEATDLALLALLGRPEAAGNWTSPPNPRCPRRRCWGRPAYS